MLFKKSLFLSSAVFNLISAIPTPVQIKNTVDQTEWQDPDLHITVWLTVTDNNCGATRTGSINSQLALSAAQNEENNLPIVNVDGSGISTTIIEVIDGSTTYTLSQGNSKIKIGGGALMTRSSLVTQSESVSTLSASATVTTTSETIESKLSTKTNSYNKSKIVTSASADTAIFTSIYSDSSSNKSQDNSDSKDKSYSKPENEAQTNSGFNTEVKTIHSGISKDTATLTSAVYIDPANDISTTSVDINSMEPSATLINMASSVINTLASKDSIHSADINSPKKSLTSIAVSSNSANSASSFIFTSSTIENPETMVLPNSNSFTGISSAPANTEPSTTTDNNDDAMPSSSLDYLTNTLVFVKTNFVTESRAGAPYIDTIYEGPSTTSTVIATAPATITSAPSDIEGVQTIVNGSLTTTVTLTRTRYKT
ncbi:hypothetical protein NADFUDRAFT_52707, partial [Nadsonia fulvescens var. elongata DSM 6958]